MALSQNDELLVKTLEALPLLDGRFEGMRLVNYDAVNSRKRGCFSLVFHATDRTSGLPVALKFFVIDPQWYLDAYRREAFRRENAILQVVAGAQRCLQLVTPYSEFQFTLPVAAGSAVTIPCPYFAIEWIDRDVDEYFLEQHKFDAATKLHLFNDIVLAVESLHRREVFHRDLKPDNIRARGNGSNTVVVVIDLGTAARHSSNVIQNQYGKPVGAHAYAAPEAICGLAGVRALAPFTDLYALGCLLFELFNPGLFYRALSTRNPRYQAMLTGMGTFLGGAATDAEKVEAWKRGLTALSHGAVPVPLDGPGSSVPPGIGTLLNEVLSRLTAVDYRKRPPNLQWVRGRVWAAIRSVEGQAIYGRRVAHAREMRRRRIEKARLKRERLAQFLARGNPNA